MCKGELIIRTSTVGYDDHVTAKGFGLGAVQNQEKYVVLGLILQRWLANELSAVNEGNLHRESSREETELIVAAEVKFAAG